MGTNQSKNKKGTRKSAEAYAVKEWELDYSLKKKPVIAIRRGKADYGQYNASGLALSEHNQLIYIVYFSNCCIEVVTFEGYFVTSFGEDILKGPWGIAVAEYHVFVTDSNLNALFQFSDFNLARTGTRGSGEGELCYPNGLCIDYNGDVYVADSMNNRVCIYSDLTFRYCLGTQQLILPRDVRVTPYTIVVLDWSPYCIHFFSRSGYLINSCVSQRPSGMVMNPWFYCLDTAGNILISDFYNHKIKILSPTGQLMHIIGKRGHGRGELIRPFGICISQLGTIFVISGNSNFCIQSF